MFDGLLLEKGNPDLFPCRSNPFVEKWKQLFGYNERRKEKKKNRTNYLVHCQRPLGDIIRDFFFFNLLRSQLKGNFYHYTLSFILIGELLSISAV